MKTNTDTPSIGKSKVLLFTLILVIGSLVVFLGLGEIVTRIAVGHPLITQPDELLFWKYKPNQVGHQKLYSPISRVDGNGFRYAGKDYDPNLPSIYIGGDSYTWGDGVLDHETFAGQLQTRLTENGLNYNVLNGGVPGYGTEQIISRMQLECGKFDVEYALLMWVETDINRLRNISPEKRQKFIRDFRLRSMFRYSAFLKLIKEQIFDQLIHKDIGFGYHGDENITYAKQHAFEDKVKDLTPQVKGNVEWLRERNIIPVWVFMTVPSEKFRNYLMSVAKDVDVILIDPEPAYREHFPGLKNMSTEHSGHFIPEVYGLLVDEVYQRVFVEEIDSE